MKIRMGTNSSVQADSCVGPRQCTNLLSVHMRSGEIFLGIKHVKVANP